MPLIRGEISLCLTWSAYFVIISSIDRGTFAITDTELYIPEISLSTVDNKKLLKQLKLGFKKTFS